MTGTPQPAAAGPLVLETREGAVAILMLNRPERLNALNLELRCALSEALRRAAEDAAVRCVVLTGAGRAFCSGGDLALLRDVRRRNAGAELESLLRGGKEIVLSICTMPKPVLAAVHGPAAGAGMSIALACDVRIASEEAVFGQNFARVGLFPDFGATYFLPRLAGTGVAAEMFYTGEMIPAAEAARFGIVNRVVPAAAFPGEVRGLAQRLASAPPIAARALKQVLFENDRAALERALDFEIEMQMKCFPSEDCLEGLNAFFEKRAPEFHGR
jgi:enoyl-CoA hydratase/carnithine racemase